MTQIYTDVEEWLRERPRWLQDAASRLIKNDNSLNETDHQELIELCKAEAQILDSDIEFMSIIPNSLSAKDSSSHLRIDAIKNVRGISALKPRNPLNFDGSLSIVYGHNGSGKSSYVRLLKHISGAKKPGKLIGNVFVQDQQSQECSLTYTSNGNTKEIMWTPEMGSLSELSPVQLYDTSCANVYVNDENEVAYEPWLLQFFSQLTNTCINVGQAIKQEMDSISLTKLSAPEGSSKTVSILWLNNINENTSIKDIDTYCTWLEADEHELNNIRQQLTETDPIEKMKQYRNSSKNIKKLHSLLSDVNDSMSVELCTEIINAKSDYLKKKKAADEDAIKVFEGLPLEGVGTDSWKLLWEHAKSFSEQHAYPNETFPYTSINSNCVLCHQPLSSEARERLNSFESYVKAALNKQADDAEDHLKSLLSKIKEVPNDSLLELHFNSIGITSYEEKRRVVSFCSVLQKRSDSLKEATSLDQISPLPSKDILSAFDEVAIAKEQLASDYEKLSKMDNRNELKNKIIELEARKWLHQNKSAISDYVDSLKRISKFKIAQSLTNTRSLSTKKSSLSDELITAEYIKRFQKELKELGGARINVNLEKTKAERGHIYHQIRLANCSSNIRTSEVLSEGEFRIVSLAGFLADVEGSSNNAPFVFDDPISSLDQLFEEATVKRIAKLSQSRQVIVFTHRLSFLTLLEGVASELGVKCNVTWLRSESWGSGEPGGTPVYAKNPKSALNSLMNERLNRAQKVLNEHGRIEYDILAKGICSDFRILIERFIEIDLLSDVVQRFRRSVHTLGKIQKLAYITADDCKMFEEYMTKYSTYEHSQPYETPVMLPEPDELRADMEKIIVWLKDFDKRKK
ncbi:AAA family ATPase [Paenibacillus thiaminolyticus]|uniref:AAA family ATPase n=1 Tax=Paenibacillus thiaminolyticus TaxID=49283 RepID=A0AAP9IZN9_PANTH|nr:AAA family ATPase [Paenibacillus thiaminolyticus]MCY9534635.1 AAA family ATPase [Paenibacillus thiaminolyticus]MCY9603408.1 AAA family ATPase [Paenibacillus thiaminolyticus]MCY9611012.1 AAA family ATPase [Paenibacillus thiaminolyticus]MCY9616647.1 AAA family ATPase [Paenibacillus thiaminolyticus]MCY9622031.1 AAA family ATPase [Paenibacillus thiaminolyticus]